MASPRESNSMSLKRKFVEDFLSKECKSRRIKAENGPSFDSSTKRCKCGCIRPNLANDCVNFLKSGIPIRIMYYKQGSWHNFPEQIMRFLIEEFSGSKSSAVSVMDGDPVLIDFLSMTMVNLKSNRQRSVAWIDNTSKCFSPSLFFDEEIYDMVKGDAANVQGNAQGMILDKPVNSPPEVVKQVVVESSLLVSQKPSGADILRKKITSVERGSKDFLFVQDRFLSGMGPFATANNLLRVYRYSPNDITAQCRLQAFERQIISTREQRGDANVRYGWLGSRKNDIVRILINGLGTTEKPAEKSDLSAGVYLSPENRTFTSVGLCDVDEKGVQYILLCQVIMGNMEAVDPGSQELFPSSDVYDSGVDDCLEPKCYVMWPSHLSTHMRLEYLVSFKLTPDFRSYLLHLKGLWFRPPKEVAIDISTLEPASCEIGEGPTTPWIPFKVLFGLVQDNISSIAKELLFHHYEELKESKITREEMVKKMMIIAGKKLLLEALNKLSYCPSSWYKSSAKAVSSDPARMAAEHDPARTAAQQLSLDETSRDCSLTLSSNCVDSHAPSAMVAHSAAVSTNGFGALPTDIVPKGHDCIAPSGVPKISSSAGVKCPGPKGRDFPRQVISRGNSPTQYARYQDPIVTRMPPVSRDALLRTASGISASPGMEVCNSATPTTGLPCASLVQTNTYLVPTNASKSHGILATGFAHGPRGCESSVPSLALGESKIAGAKYLSSAPVTPGGQEFLSLSIASQSLVPHSVKRSDSSTAVRPPLYAPGRGHSPSVSTGVHDSLTLSMTTKGHSPSASRAEPKCHGSPTVAMESCRPQVMDATTKVHNAPTPSTMFSFTNTNACAGDTAVTRELKDQAAQNKEPGPVLEASSIDAADTLITLSTPREKGEQ
ncbi:hypothetical protein HU200_006739 [Digitaria exilis]|uniref:Poly [ADP-ribose] polymerase n=1 Tax=Digitaria exilis TaxID=1010633 RepID=A0A835KRR3_9POAL|nr:hypothetical protein HU200_006739 [Digitaria exilis]